MVIVVFGGSGFLGSRVVEELLHAGTSVRVATRHPDAVRPPAAAKAGTARFEAVYADVRDEGSVATALAGSDGAVNAISLYVERGDATFDAVHVQGARHVARQMATAGLDRLVHISGIGADRSSGSAYIRARAHGEEAVRAALPAATIVRPSAMFGPGDALVANLDAITRLAPVIPLFGQGETRLQPVCVGDVAAAAARLVQRTESRGETYEFGGPEVLTYRSLVERLLAYTQRRCVLLPVPFGVWDLVARGLGALPSPPLTKDQVALMKRDNVAADDRPGFAELGMAPTALDKMLPDILPKR